MVLSMHTFSKRSIEFLAQQQARGAAQQQALEQCQEHQGDAGITDPMMLLILKRKAMVSWRPLII